MPYTPNMFARSSKPNRSKHAAGRVGKKRPKRRNR